MSTCLMTTFHLFFGSRQNPDNKRSECQATRRQWKLLICHLTCQCTCHSPVPCADIKWLTSLLAKAEVDMCTCRLQQALAVWERWLRMPCASSSTTL